MVRLNILNKFNRIYSLQSSAAHVFSIPFPFSHFPLFPFSPFPFPLFDLDRSGLTWDLDRNVGYS